MPTERLLRRFPLIAQMLLACHCDTIGKANARWLRNRLMHCDWDFQDAVRMREMSPRSLWSWLEAGGEA
jgi:hypothetical protein